MSGDSESVAAGVAIPLLRTGGAVTRAQGLQEPGLQHAESCPCAAEQPVGAVGVPGCAVARRLTMPCAGCDVPGRSPGPGGVLGYGSTMARVGC